FCPRYQCQISQAMKALFQSYPLDKRQKLLIASIGFIMLIRTIFDLETWVDAVLLLIDVVLLGLLILSCYPFKIWVGALSFSILALVAAGIVYVYFF
ncbi:MAG: hypothetical protein AAFX87_25160, partial [Bacteroidota bacterium]